MVVEKSVKELENSQIELTITVDAATLDKSYEEKIAKYAKSIEVPGFRKGHVPTSETRQAMTLWKKSLR